MMYLFDSWDEASTLMLDLLCIECFFDVDIYTRKLRSEWSNNFLEYMFGNGASLSLSVGLYWYCFYSYLFFKVSLTFVLGDELGS